MFDPGSEVIVSWDMITSVEKWKGTISGHGMGQLVFERQDGERFLINPIASRLMYIQIVKGE